MTATVTTVGVDVTDEELDAALRRELDLARRQASRVQNGDVEAALRALDRLSNFIKTIDEVRAPAGALARNLIRQALAAGVDPRELYDRPFSDTIVRDEARDLNLPPLRRGPRPYKRRAPGTPE